MGAHLGQVPHSISSSQFQNKFPVVSSQFSEKPLASPPAHKSVRATQPLAPHFSQADRSFSVYRAESHSTFLWSAGSGRTPHPHGTSGFLPPFTPWLDRESFQPRSSLCACQLAPGFAIRGVEAGVGAVMRKDVDACTAGERFDWDDDPGVFRKDVADEEVDLVGCVGDRHPARVALRGDEVGPLA